MARHCGMGITAFSQYARELVNSGPVAYLNHCRLDHAARILRQHPQRSVTSVAMECGFNSSQYFATCFRRRHRMPPQACRAPDATLGTIGKQP
jgi:AraC family L-rhamnose operon regulatory protein RhaS